MLAEIQLIAGGVVAAGVALLGLYAKYQKSQKEKYKKESEIQKDIAETVNKRVEAHEKREEIEKNNANISNDVIDDSLQQYYRDKST